MEKIKLAVGWNAACGGCDVSLLDLEEAILELAEVAEIVYWPVAMDFRRDDLRRRGTGEVDLGILCGAIRTDEQVEEARLFRDRCKALVAYGACAAFGGVCGLANLSSAAAILETAYGETASTDNPEAVRPLPRSEVNGHVLSLPALEPSCRALCQVVDVDLTVPGCPPPSELGHALVRAAIDHAHGGALPPRGTVLGSSKALCDECPRVSTRTGQRMTAVRRPHQLLADPGLCFLEQGLICLGLGTRGGCGASCLRVNQPCRGCFGPTDAMLDPGGDALSAIGSIAAQPHEDDLTQPARTAAVRAIADLVGTFYRFTLATAILSRRVEDQPAAAKR